MQSDNLWPSSSPSIPPSPPGALWSTTGQLCGIQEAREGLETIMKTSNLELKAGQRGEESIPRQADQMSSTSPNV